MTADKHFKRKVREEARRTGKSYAATRLRMVTERVAQPFRFDLNVDDVRHMLAIEAVNSVRSPGNVSIPFASPADRKLSTDACFDRAAAPVAAGPRGADASPSSEALSEPAAQTSANAGGAGATHG